MRTIPQKLFYVYTLADQHKNVFYVGKGKGPRVHKHEYEAETNCDCPKCNRIREIWVAGGKVVKKIVFETNNEREALQHERKVIQRLGRENLCNRSNGGEGATWLQGEELEDALHYGRQAATRRALLRAADPRMYKEMRLRLDEQDRRAEEEYQKRKTWARERTEELRAWCIANNIPKSKMKHIENLYWNERNR